VVNPKPGDQGNAAAAIVDIASAVEPPLHLLLGADCVAAVQQKTQQLLTGIETWRAVWTSTDHD
jgi:hypothetical protein